MLNSNEFGPTVASNVENNSGVSKIKRSVAGNVFSLAREKHAVVLLPWRDMARPALLSALAEFIRETFKGHGTVVLKSISSARQ